MSQGYYPIYGSPRSAPAWQARGLDALKGLKSGPGVATVGLGAVVGALAGALVGRKLLTAMLGVVVGGLGFLGVKFFRGGTAAKPAAPAPSASAPAAPAATAPSAAPPGTASPTQAASPAAVVIPPVKAAAAPPPAHAPVVLQGQTSSAAASPASPAPAAPASPLTPAQVPTAGQAVPTAHAAPAPPLAAVSAPAARPVSHPVADPVIHASAASTAEGLNRHESARLELFLDSAPTEHRVAVYTALRLAQRFASTRPDVPAPGRLDSELLHALGAELGQSPEWSPETEHTLTALTREALQYPSLRKALSAYLEHADFIQDAPNLLEMIRAHGDSKRHLPTEVDDLRELVSTVYSESEASKPVSEPTSAPVVRRATVRPLPPVPPPFVPTHEAVAAVTVPAQAAVRASVPDVQGLQIATFLAQGSPEDRAMALGSLRVIKRKDASALFPGDVRLLEALEGQCVGTPLWAATAKTIEKLEEEISSGLLMLIALPVYRKSGVLAQVIAPDDAPSGAEAFFAKPRGDVKKLLALLTPVFKALPPAPAPGLLADPAGPRSPPPAG